ncbi:hypothetical protein BGZ73_005409 [Actinomortierella ambigua]|nr:hypothetical protein BGZ73_005409 [Actinomortierella ambigua]
MLFSKALLLLASATLALAQQAVVSKGILTSEDKTDKNAMGAEIYLFPQNHQAAVATILQTTSLTAGYHPHNQRPTEAAKTYAKFERLFPKIAGFTTVGQDEIAFEIGSDLDDLQRKIIKNYRSSDTMNIARTLRWLVPTSVEVRHAAYWAISVVAIDQVKPKATQARLITLALRLDVDGEGEVTLPSEQTAFLNVITIDVDFHYLVNNAKLLAKTYGVSNTEKFHEFFSSQKKITLTQWLRFGAQRQS